MLFARNIDEARGLFANMKNEGLQLTRETHMSMLRALAKVGDISACLAEIEELKGQNIILSDKDVLDLVYESAVGGHEQHCQTLLDTIDKSNNYNRLVVKLINRLLQKNQDNVAFTVLKSMTRNSNDSGELVNSGNFYIRQLIRLKRSTEEISAVCAKMEEAQLHSAPQDVWKQRSSISPSDALARLRELKTKNVTLKDDDFRTLFGTGDNMEMLRIMIEEFSVVPSLELLRDFVLKHENWQKPQDVLHKLLTLKIPYRAVGLSVAVNCLRRDQIKDAACVMVQYRLCVLPSILYRPLTDALKATGDVKHYVVCLQTMYDNFHSKDSGTDDVEETKKDALGHMVYRTLIALDPDSRVSTSEAILGGLVARGLTITKNKAKLIENVLQSNITSTIQTNLMKLSSGTLVSVPLQKNAFQIEGNSEYLERLLTENKANDVTKTRLTLLRAYRNDKNLIKFEALLRQMEDEKEDLGRRVYAQWISLQLDLGDLNAAIQTLEQVKQKLADFNLGSKLAIQFASALFDDNRFDEALNFLNEHKSAEAPTKDNGQTRRMASTLLNKVAVNSTMDNVHKLFNSLINNNHVLINNGVLNCVIRGHLIKNEIEQTVETFKQFTKAYKLTPLRQTLYNHFITNDDLVNLQKIADASSAVYGEQSSLQDLAFAFIECTRLVQARRIFEMPALVLRRDKMVYYLDNWVECGRVDCLEGLLEATKTIEHFDRSEIHNRLLTVYCREGLTEKALELWLTMQEDGDAPSNVFLVELSKLLQSKGLNVPFIIPESTPNSMDADAEKANVKTTAVQPKKTVFKSERAKALAEVLKTGKSDDIRQAYQQLESADELDGVFPNGKYFSRLLVAFAHSGDVLTVERIIEQGNNLKIEGIQNINARLLSRAYFEAGRVDELLTKWTDNLKANQDDSQLKQWDKQFSIHVGVDLLKNAKYMSQCK